ncbi:hypothetical protein HLRTI_000461 [Halorhabdus tiamatea SARL4B]|uniref:Uncharacterized protein n=1 Tax=Halorhabdus tiamatea SARL4B TaxID=1033806 RepID=F7PLN0_9EURY|nr:hypothetical protein [Halorhabdus tiamatea]ERJ07419.1 hypothetical protein HLRTI_000461 [Halorhabdus tiamatea SARL4B]
MATQQKSEAEIEAGKFARDADQIDDEDEDEVVIVLEQTGRPIDEIVVYREPNGVVHTVDEWNDEYDPSDEGIEAVYRSSVDAAFDGEWTVSDVMDAYRAGNLTTSRAEGGYGLKTYTLPTARLVSIGGSDA